MIKKYTILLLIIFLLISIFVPKKIFALDPCESCACGGEQTGPNSCQCNICGGGGGGEPECTGANQCAGGSVCCGGECIAGGCPGGALTCNSGTVSNGACTAENQASCTCPGCSFVTDPETGARRCQFPTPVQAQALCCVPIPPSCGTTCTQCAGGTQCSQCSAVPNQGYYCSCTGPCGGAYTSCTGALDPVRCPPGASPPPATSPGCGAFCPPPPPASITGTIFNDPDNNCSNTPLPRGWVFGDPLSFYADSWVTVNGTPAPLFPGQKSGILFTQNGGMYSQTDGGPTGNTVYLTGIPAGYRCSDCNTSRCPIRSNVAKPSTGIDFYITNKAATPTPPPPLPSWWQAKDGDLTSGGDITSIVPTTKYLNLVGLGGFPGVPIFSGVLTTGLGTVSTKLWNANATTSLTRLFDYSYFSNLIPDDVTLNNRRYRK